MHISTDLTLIHSGALARAAEQHKAACKRMSYIFMVAALPYALRPHHRITNMK